MANNTYGVVRPSLITNIEKDVEIWYNYKTTRNSENTEDGVFKKLDNPSEILSNSKVANPLIDGDDRLPGMYNLNLPVSIFGKKGIYTIYIKPKDLVCTIKDVGALSAYPDIRGIVIDLNSIQDKSLFETDNLVGYRIEYYDYSENSMKRQEYYRLITSNNYCEPVSQNLTSANSNSNGYRFNNNGSLCFITVTPSTAPTFKGNAIPYIGSPNQKIVITNTKFDPVMIELEMCEHDIETLSIMAEGEQVRNLENGRISTYNFDGEIYKQYEFSTIKNNYSKSNIIEAKINKKDNIDFSVNLDEIKNI